jgi:hypothetical protein
MINNNIGLKSKKALNFTKIKIFWKKWIGYKEIKIMNWKYRIK